MTTRFEFYLDRRGDTRWRAVAPENGRVLADSAQGYTDRRDAVKGLSRILQAAQNGAEIVDVKSDPAALAAGQPEGVHDADNEGDLPA